MNPDEQSQPGQNPIPNTPTPSTPPVGDVQPQVDAQPPTAPTFPAPGSQPGSMPSPDQQIPSGPATPEDSTPGVPPTAPTTGGGAYGQGTMQPETPPTMPPVPGKHLDKRKTGLVLLLVVIVALAAVAWLLAQAFSG